jgi:hypothetical protein
VEGGFVRGAHHTIGGHVKCSVRSIFSCCFALAIFCRLVELLLEMLVVFTCAVATRRGRVYLRLGCYWTAVTSATASPHLALCLL